MAKIVVLLLFVTTGCLNAEKTFQEKFQGILGKQKHDLRTVLETYINTVPVNGSEKFRETLITDLAALTCAVIRTSFVELLNNPENMKKTSKPEVIINNWATETMLRTKQTIGTFLEEKFLQGICCQCNRCFQTCSQCGRSCCCNGDSGCTCVSCSSQTKTNDIYIDSTLHLIGDVNTLNKMAAVMDKLEKFLIESEKVTSCSCQTMADCRTCCSDCGYTSCSGSPGRYGTCY